MKIAKMDRRITLERVTNGRDAVGGVSESWATLTTVWAERRNLKGRELMEAAQKSAEAEVLFVVRYSTVLGTVSAADRVKMGTEYFDVVSVTEVPGGRPVKVELLTKRAA